MLEVVVVIVGIVALAVALGWAAYRYHTRNRANDQVTEAATKALYEDPEGYDERRRELNKKLGSS